MDLIPGSLTILWSHISTYVSMRMGCNCFVFNFRITATMSVPALSLYFTSYEVLKWQLLRLTNSSASHGPQLDKQGQLGLASNESKVCEMKRSFLQELALDSTCGFAAEAISCVLWLPIDVCKERLQVSS